MFNNTIKQKTGTRYNKITKLLKKTIKQKMHYVLKECIIFPQIKAHTNTTTRTEIRINPASKLLRCNWLFYNFLKHLRCKHNVD